VNAKSDALAHRLCVEAITSQWRRARNKGGDLLGIGWLHRCGERANRRCSVGVSPPAPQGRVPRPGCAGQTLDRPTIGANVEMTATTQQ